MLEGVVEQDDIQFGALFPELTDAPHAIFAYSDAYIGVLHIEQHGFVAYGASGSMFVGQHEAACTASVAA